ncbi:ATP synthase-like protein mitochondrial F1 complex assembly factor 2 [Tribonema minus]|uniref:ATP synthase-like protein mitochondrial F1 complex assembly factor 2 n=1 Tax=Tribonema minus TaxID=303371 RepID=A0A835YM22_9STRA|nr:ATP synthase-like protein mitochondrial F1 complex assembly factor 2 [Tribonema minus]
MSLSLGLRRCTKRALGCSSALCRAACGPWQQQHAADLPLRCQRRNMSVQDTVHQKIKGRRRFYKIVSVDQVKASDSSGPQWQVLLDNRPLRTPARRPLHFPTEALARAVAAEWDAQTRSTGIEPAVMPLMTLCATALDQVAVNPEPTIDNVMNYLHTDTVCFFAPDDDRIILKRQKKTWGPLHTWASKALGGELVKTQHAIARPQHPPEVVDQARAIVAGLDPFALSAVQCITMECKSLVVALAVAYRQITMEQAFDAARLEEGFNIEHWGLVEGGHDLDICSTKLQLSAASMLLWLTRDVDNQLSL